MEQPRPVIPPSKHHTLLRRPHTSNPYFRCSGWSKFCSRDFHHISQSARHRRCNISTTTLNIKNISSAELKRSSCCNLSYFWFPSNSVSMKIKNTVPEENQVKRKIKKSLPILYVWLQHLFEILWFVIVLSISSAL